LPDPNSYAPEVIADSSGWSGNALRFPTAEEAEEWVQDLSRRWLLVQETRVVASDDPPNYKLVNGEVIRIKEDV
jgi:hypothetical protein